MEEERLGAKKKDKKRLLLLALCVCFVMHHLRGIYLKALPPTLFCLDSRSTGSA